MSQWLIYLRTRGRTKCGVEPPTRIEGATCGLRTVPDPTSDNLNPQETTTQEIGEMALDGGGLSCPGSSVVADQASGDDE